MTPTSVKLPEKSLREVRRAATLSGELPAAFMRRVIQQAAQQVLVEHAKSCPTCGARMRRRGTVAA